MPSTVEVSFCHYFCIDNTQIHLLSSVVQPVSLALNRSDYMVSGDSGKSLELADVKLVEINTMAAGSGGCCQQLNGWHKLVAG